MFTIQANIEKKVQIARNSSGSPISNVEQIKYNFPKDFFFYPYVFKTKKIGRENCKSLQFKTTASCCLTFESFNFFYIYLDQSYDINSFPKFPKISKIVSHIQLGSPYRNFSLLFLIFGMTFALWFQVLEVRFFSRQ